MIQNKRIPPNIQALEQKLAMAVSVQQKIDEMNDLAWQLRILDPKRASLIGSEALALAQTGFTNSQPYEYGLASALTVLAFMDGEAGNLDASISRCLETLLLLTSQPQSNALVKAWYVLGWAYFYSGDYPAALEFGLKCLKAARENGDAEWEAWCLDLVASSYKDPEDAVNMYQRSYDIFTNLNNLEGQVRILNNWACTLLEAKKFEQALELAQKGLHLARAGELQLDEINIVGTIGEIFISQGKLAEAQTTLHEATLLFDSYGRDISSVYVLVDLGEVYLKQNQIELAEQVLFNALEGSEKMELRNEQARCHRYLSEIFETKGMFNKALEHYKRFQTLRESLVGEGALKQLAALRASQQIETAKRDAEIHKLQTEKLQLELDEHKRLHIILENLATLDPLTNLFNRRHFMNLAEKEWKRAMRYQHPLCVLMLDLDHFKQINDQYGHAIGDQALILVAAAIRSTLRSTEIAGRYGGDEFVILLPETQPQNGLKAAQRVCQVIAGQELSLDGSGMLKITSSIGFGCISAILDDNLKTINELLRRADQALYEAKRAGGNRVLPYIE